MEKISWREIAKKYVIGNHQLAIAIKDLPFEKVGKKHLYCVDDVKKAMKKWREEQQKRLAESRIRAAQSCRETFASRKAWNNKLDWRRICSSRLSN